MISNLVTLLKISRPRFWLYLAGPFIIGYVSGITAISELLTLQFWSYLLYFLLPANIFLYGINDLADGDTDKFNAKKQGYETLLRVNQKHWLKMALWYIILLTLFLAVVTYSITTVVLLGGWLFLSYAYSQTPFRWKSKPLIDSASNVLYILPGLLAYYLATQTLPNWRIILGCGLWAAAMHLFSAIPDITADSKAALKTTAVVLGSQRALVACSLLWLGSALILFSYFKVWWLWPIFIYCLLPITCVLKLKPVADVYRVFPYVNAGLGFILFWCIFLYRF